MEELELWGGHECTLNRVGSEYFDQTVLTGHQDRPEDLDRFAALGLEALRYPVLWERAAAGGGPLEWGWTDARLARISELRLRPICGLLHHGSGPPATNLLDPAFPTAFAAYARAAAQRYPWVRDWTPINEPLTTARFSALYGHWFPHAADEKSFWTALINQIDATRLAMREIRAVRSDARLIQTEDLGRTYATPAMAHQASFDNARRWMTWDLLEGRVTREHRLWSRLERFGLTDRLQALGADPTPPDVLGVNHYLTSDRFLDHRIAAYPAERIGGNDFMAFADVEAVRCVVPGPGGLEGVLDEAWERYGRPLAVTESHNGCTREEQMRWVAEAWRAAQTLRARGVNVGAVTAWALLGSIDWDGLLTRRTGAYEVGAFDIRQDPPRTTALAGQLPALREGAAPHPASQGPGWWRRDIRLQFKPVYRSVETPTPPVAWRAEATSARPLLITGATGTLGKALARACQWRGIAYHLTARRDLPLDDEAAIDRVLRAVQPWAVINAAGWVRVDEAEAAADACMAVNALGALSLARACRDLDLPFVGFSSDLVFDGRSDQPYVESDRTAPLNVYGVSKAQAERTILELGGKPLMVRTAAFFSAFDPHNFAAHVVRTLAAGKVLDAAEDLIVSPTHVPDLVDAVLDLLIDGETGLRHLANGGAVSWAEFGRRISAALGLDRTLIRGVPAASFGWAAERPAQVSLGTERGFILPPLETAIERFARTMRASDFAAENSAPLGGEPTSPLGDSVGLSAASLGGTARPHRP
jgi:dTDP-4-dehydrorhamnose reductase